MRLELKVDLSKQYGIVLEGGGAKGAYQIGAWKALQEAGIQICSVAGTSVGALNGALICMGDVANAERLWEEISYSKVIDVDDELMGSIFQGKISSEVIKNGVRLLSDGGADITPLRNLIAQNVDEDCIRNSGIEFYLLTFSLTDWEELDLDLKEIEKDGLNDLLLASAYLPIFKNQKLLGKTFMDGGMFNNVPLESLVKRGYKDIIMLRIYGPGREKKVPLTDDVVVHTIGPRVNLGNLLDFDSKKSKRNMQIGYYDACRWLYELSGVIYYIDEQETEIGCLQRLMEIDRELKEAVLKDYKISYKETNVERIYLELLLPAIATELKLSKDWNYKQLYVSMLEAAAKQLRIQKYNIYTIEELLESMNAKEDYYKKLKKFPTFVKIIMKRDYI